MTRVGILGIGGVGGYLGAKLAAKYHGSVETEIVFIARGENQKAIKTNGLKLITPSDEITGFPHIVSDDPHEIGKLDLLICCVKSYHLEEALINLKPNIDKNAVILPLLNGVDSGSRIKEIYPDIEVWDGCVYILARLSKPGIVSELGNIHQFHFGSSDGSPEKLKALERILVEAGIDTHLSKNIEQTIWDKFLLISTIASLTSALNLSIREIFANDSHVKTLNGLMNELVAVGEASGVVFSEGVVEKTCKILASSPVGTTSSMHSDFERGGNTEYLSLTEFVVKKGKSLNVPTPHYERVLISLEDKTKSAAR